MHNEVIEFFQEAKTKYPSFFDNKKVLEVGSLFINGSVRDLFTNCEYIGIDLGPGQGVDVISKAHEYKHPSEFDVVASTEMLEHDCYWKESLAVMYENIKPGGIMIFTCAGPDRAEHGTSKDNAWASPFTTDYYRNISVEDFESILPKSLFSESEIKYYRGKNDLYFVGIKNI